MTGEDVVRVELSFRGAVDAEAPFAGPLIDAIALIPDEAR